MIKTELNKVVVSFSWQSSSARSVTIWEGVLYRQSVKTIPFHTITFPAGNAYRLHLAIREGKGQRLRNGAKSLYRHIHFESQNPVKRRLYLKNKRIKRQPKSITRKQQFAHYKTIGNDRLKRKFTIQTQNICSRPTTIKDTQLNQ